MKTAEEIQTAEDIIVISLAQKTLSLAQRNILCGMSVALQWVMEAPGRSTLEELVAGKPIIQRK